MNQTFSRFETAVSAISGPEPEAVDTARPPLQRECCCRGQPCEQAQAPLPPRASERLRMGLRMSLRGTFAVIAMSVALAVLAAGTARPARTLCDGGQHHTNARTHTRERSVCMCV
jgi:hypothetical protein